MVSDRWNPRLWIRDWLSRPNASEHTRRSQLERAIVRTASTDIARMKRDSIEVPSVAVDAVTGSVTGVELRTYSLGEPAKSALPPEAAPPASCRAGAYAGLLPRSLRWLGRGAQ